MEKINPFIVGSRIKTERATRGFNQQQFGEKIGIQQSAVSAIEKGDRLPTIEQLMSIMELFGRSADFWLFGDVKSINYEQLGTHSEGHMVADSAEIRYQSTVKMPVRALAGAGNPCDLEQLTPIGHITIEADYDGPNIVALQIRGNSMEPNIMNGAHVGVDRTDREIISGQLYAIYIPYEGIVVKRIFVGPELIKIKSDNPAFPDHDLSIDRINWDTFVQGRVKWVLQKY